MSVLTDRRTKELEEFIVFAIAVAGKTAKQISAALSVFYDLGDGDSPFEVIQNMIKTGQLPYCLKKARLGNYTKLDRAYRELVSSNIDLHNCSVSDLEKIHGIGPKTSRYFILHTRANAQVAALDVHILHWLRDLGYDTPKSTPTGKKYAQIEKWFLDEAKKLNADPAELDLRIWRLYSKSSMPNHHKKQATVYRI